MSFLSYITLLLPATIMIPLTYHYTQVALQTNCLVSHFKIQFPETINFEYKVSLAFRIGSLIAVYLFLNVLSVIASRFATGAANPLKDQGNDMVNTFNKVLTNSVEQTLIFFPLFANYIINLTQNEDEIKFGLSLALIWLIGRVLFFVTYPLGTLINFSSIRAIGFIPTLFPSIILALKIFSINLF
jgi:hypothetical protein